MSLNPRDLSVLAYANGFTLWHYKFPAGIAEVATSRDLLAGADEIVRSGDMLMVSAHDGAKIVVVTGSASNLAAVPLA